MVNIKYYLLTSAIVLFVFVFYKWLIRYLHRNEITIPFTFLYPFERDYFTGSESITIDLPADSKVRVEILNENGSLTTVSYEEFLQKGVREIKLDLSALKNGKYNLRILFPDQSITRFIEVRN